MSKNSRISKESIYETPLVKLKADPRRYGTLRSKSFHANAVMIGDVEKGLNELTYKKPTRKYKAKSRVSKERRPISSKNNPKGNKSPFPLRGSFTFKHKQSFPLVYLRDKSGRCSFDPVRFGTDIFLKAGLKPEKTENPSLVVLEALPNKSLIVSNHENGTKQLSKEEKEGEMNLLNKKLKQRAKKKLTLRKKSKDEAMFENWEQEELNNFTLEKKKLYILPAGAYTMRDDTIGVFFRTFMNTVIPVVIQEKTAKPVRVACVVLPVLRFHKKESDDYKEGDCEEYLMITQRQHRKNGAYNDLWVFPGGHVESGESLETGAAREVREETGLDLTEEQLIPLCCWQEFNVAKKVQYLIVVFYAEIDVEPEIGEVEFITTIGLQVKEVQSVAFMPRSTWPNLALKQSSKKIVKHYEVSKHHSTTSNHRNSAKFALLNNAYHDGQYTVDISLEVQKVLGVQAIGDVVEATEFSVHNIYGHGNYSGTGAPHRFAVRQLLEATESNI
eukprot:maker-scaffold_7-snap-gene-17.33-mRNA-1 protein AED:0.02 eAED:0.02 QI:80/1/1/1/0.5/0.4/5/112/500